MLTEDKGAEATHSSEPQRHMLLVSLLLWHKMVVVRCFVWPPALQLWSGRQESRVVDENFEEHFKILYLATCKCFLVVFF